jgi:hypothetical protein
VCCPNLTVKERLQVLRPDNPENYYAAFDLVPLKYQPQLQAGKVLVTNWHAFAPESPHVENGKSYAVVDKGPETPETFARRVLGDLADRLPILVLNGEGHHCWRPPLVRDHRKRDAVDVDVLLGKEAGGRAGHVRAAGPHRGIDPHPPSLSLVQALGASRTSRQQRGTASKAAR